MLDTNARQISRTVAAGVSSAEHPEAGNELRVVTWNVEHGLRVPAAIDSLTTARGLRNADIVLLQEMEAGGTEEIATTLGMHWVYAAGTVHSKTGRDFGNAILSRWPLELVEVVDLPHTARFLGEARIALGASCDLHGRELMLWSVHAEISTLGYRRQLDQYDVIAELFRRSTADFRLATGDFNTASRRNTRALADRMTDAGATHVTREIGPTYRRLRIPFVLDHLFAAGMTATRLGVAGPFPASDHAPVHATFELE